MIPGVLRRVSSPTFVGRAQELAALEAALARPPAFLFVAGESGVGKSRLLSELGARATAGGARVLVGRCLELGDTVFPYAPLIDALRPVAREAELQDATRAVLADLMPEVGGPSAPADRGRLLEALLELLSQLAADAPLLLVIEDLHWADPSTRDFLTYLVRSLRDERLALVGTYRSDELHRRHPLRPLLAELERAPGSGRIELERFSRDEVAEQLAGILDETPDPGLADRLFERGGGNALYTEELLAASAAGMRELPVTLRDALLARVERLSAGAQAVVRVAAVVERPVRHEMLAAVTGLDAAELLEAARDAVTNQVLVSGPDETYAFRHALVGEAVHDDLLPGERTALHAAVAAAIEAAPERLGEVSHARVAADLACHWRGALDLPRALGASVRAGLAARRLYAHGEALSHFESALAIWDRVPDAEQQAGMPRSELLRSAAWMAEDRFLPGRAVALLREAIAAADPEDRVRLAGLHGELAELHRAANDHDSSDQAVADAMAILPDDAAIERARLRALGAKVLLQRGYVREAAAEAHAAVESAERLGDDLLATRAGITRGYLLAALGHVAEGERLLRAARDRAPQPQQRARAVVNLSEVLDLDGRTEAALAEVQAEYPRIAARAERSAYDTFLELQGVYHLLRLGRTAEAITRLPDRLPGDAMNDSAMYLEVIRAELAVLRGDDASAREAVANLRRQTAGLRDLAWLEALARAGALLAVNEGRFDDARADVAAGLATIDSSDEGLRRLRMLWLGLYVEADAAEHASALGAEFDAEVGRTLVARLDGAVGARGGWAEGPLYALLARAEQSRLAVALGEGVADPTVWLAAADGFEELALPWPAAYARLRAAEAHVALGSAAEAAAPLGAALASAKAIQAAPIADAAEALARRARVKLERAEPAAKPAAPPPFGLTPREREVLELVSEGLTNREIGAALHMSEKTASVHVSRILGKLGVSGRVEAAAVATRAGLAGTRS